jgi:hypothetical protein
MLHFGRSVDAGVDQPAAARWRHPDGRDTGARPRYGLFVLILTAVTG